MRKGRVLEGLSLLVLCCSSGCSSQDTKPPPAEAPASSAQPSAPEPSPTPPAAAPSGAALGFDEEDTSWKGWPQVSRQDEAPVCLFSSWADWKETEFIERVKPSASLRAGHTINFGVFGPSCAAEACVRNPMLQCWVDMEGNVITLHSRYAAFEKPAVTCATDCLAVTAQCNTPQLPKGEYTVVYGAERWKLRVPSVVRPACRKRD